jgi:drug/metabolite transporter, DME family
MRWFRNGAFLALAAAVLWGTTGTAQALAPVEASPLTIGALRLIVGGAFLFLLAWGRGKLRGGGHWPLLPTALAAISMAAYQLFFFAAVSLTGVTVGTVTAVGSSPILAGLLVILVWRQPPTGRWLAATALAVSGVVLLASGGGAATVHLGGVLLALLTGLSYAIYVLSSKSLLASQPPERATAVVFALGALLLTPILFLTDLSWLARPSGLLVVLHLGVITIGLAYLLFAQGLATIPAATAVTLSLAEPLTAALLGLLFLGEQLPASGFVGIGLLFAGLLWLTRRG